MRCTASIAACTAGRRLPAFSAAVEAAATARRIELRNLPVTQPLLGAAQTAGMGDGCAAQVTLSLRIDEAELHSLGAGHALAGGGDLDRTRHPHDARQPLRAARPGNDAERYLGQSHDRAGARDARIATEREFEPAPQRCTMKRCDEGLAAAFDGGDHRGQMRLLERQTELAQVGAGNEGLACADDALRPRCCRRWLSCRWRPSSRAAPAPSRR